MSDTSDNARPKVTVGIPLYNKGAYIERAIESVLAQSFTDFEIIVVDDGSTDDGAERVRQFEDPRIRLIAQSNAGPGAARNKALAIARGAYVVFLDADDEFMPDFLEATCRFLDAHRECACVSTGVRVYPPGCQVSRLWNLEHVSENEYFLDPSQDAARAAQTIAQMAPCSTLCRVEALRKHGGFFDGYKCLFAEDQHLFIRIALNYPIGFIKEPHVIYHTECSELAGNVADRTRPVEPFLLDPEPLRAACPPEKRDLLERILEVRAVWSAHHFTQVSKPPDYATARRLLRRFPHVGGVSSSQRRRVELWSYAPWLGRMLRAAKGILSGTARVGSQRGIPTDNHVDNGVETGE